MSRPYAHGDRWHKTDHSLSDNQSPSRLQDIRQDRPDPDEHHVDGSSSNRDGVDLRCGPTGCAVRILDGLQKQAEVTITVLGQHRTDVQQGDEVGNPHPRRPLRRCPGDLLGLGATMPLEPLLSHASVLGREPERTGIWSRRVVGKHEETCQSNDDCHATIDNEQPSPPRNSVSPIDGVKNSGLQSAGHHAADSLAAMVESHAFCNFRRGVPVHCEGLVGRTQCP